MNEKAREVLCRLQPMYSCVIDIMISEKDEEQDEKKAAEEYMISKGLTLETFIEWSRHRFPNVLDVSVLNYIADGLEVGFGFNEFGRDVETFRRHISDYEYYLSKEDSTNALLDRIVQLEAALGLSTANDKTG